MKLIMKNGSGAIDDCSDLGKFVLKTSWQLGAIKMPLRKYEVAFEAE